MGISTVLFYILTFLAVYVQVFFLVTFIENRDKIKRRTGETKLSKYPAVTVMVPCWNEEKTVYGTVRSLLALNYPMDKLNIFLIDDGSTDGTYAAIKRFEKYNNITIFKKENGGKHTALNLGLQHAKTDFVACLDADSSADPQALARLMSYFERDPKIMAIAPSIIVRDPKSLTQHAQKAEYHMAVYVKKMLGFLGAIHVTPGPLTVFRKKVFEDLGPYRKAHNTEDMEIAYRMQTNGYKIEQCHDAYIYTGTPPSVRTLYKQRVRWIYGFINNTIDYRSIIFRKKYGNFAWFTIPSGIISVLAAIYLFSRFASKIGHFIAEKFTHVSAVGFDFTPKAPSFDPFFFNASSLLFITIFLYSSVILSMIIGHRMANGKWGFSINMVYFFCIFSVAAPFWLAKAIFATVFARKPAWR